MCGGARHSKSLRYKHHLKRPIYRLARSLTLDNPDTLRDLDTKSTFQYRILLKMARLQDLILTSSNHLLKIDPNVYDIKEDFLRLKNVIYSNVNRQYLYEKTCRTGLWSLNEHVRTSFLILTRRVKQAKPERKL